MPGDPGATVVTNACVYYSTHAATGAAGTRHSPRPLGRTNDAKLGRHAPRECAGVFVFRLGCLKFESERRMPVASWFETREDALLTMRPHPDEEHALARVSQ